MELFEHPFAILVAVFFFQVGNEVAYRPAQTRWRDAVFVLAAVAAATAAIDSALLYASGAGLALGFLLTLALAPDAR